MSNQLKNLIEEFNTSEHDKTFYSSKNITNVCCISGLLAFGLFCFFGARKYLKDTKSETEQILEMHVAVKQKFASLFKNLEETISQTETLSFKLNEKEFNALNFSLQKSITGICNDFEYIKKFLEKAKISSNQSLVMKDLDEIKLLSKKNKQEVIERIKFLFKYCLDNSASDHYEYRFRRIVDYLKIVENDVENFYSCLIEK